MRVLIIVAVASGAGAVLGSTTHLHPVPQSVVGATRPIAALGGDLSNFNAADLLSKWSASDVNPIRAAYDYVAQQIATPRTPESLGFPTSTFTVPKMVDLGAMMGGAKLDFDASKLWGESIAQQNRLFNDHMQDIQNYSRNPAGWHGAPPF